MLFAIKLSVCFAYVVIITNAIFAECCGAKLDVFNFFCYAELQIRDEKSPEDGECLRQRTWLNRIVLLRLNKTILN
jgi:hypothetical protein